MKRQVQALFSSEDKRKEVLSAAILLGSLKVNLAIKWALCFWGNLFCSRINSLTTKKQMTKFSSANFQKC